MRSSARACACLSDHSVLPSSFFHGVRQNSMRNQEIHARRARCCWSPVRTWKGSYSHVASPRRNARQNAVEAEQAESVMLPRWSCRR